LAGSWTKVPVPASVTCFWLVSTEIDIPEPSFVVKSAILVSTAT